MFSILIPSYNNLDYLKVCIDSIKKNSKFVHEITLLARIAIPSLLTELGKDLFGVVAALTGHDRIVLGKGSEVVRVPKRGRRSTSAIEILGPGLTDLAGGIERRRQTLEIALRAHALEQHRSNHSSPANNSDLFNRHSAAFISITAVLRRIRSPENR